jgi:cell division protein FtsL
MNQDLLRLNNQVQHKNGEQEQLKKKVRELNRQLEVSYFKNNIINYYFS